MGLTPGWGTKIPRAAWLAKKKGDMWSKVLMEVGRSGICPWAEQIVWDRKRDCNLSKINETGNNVTSSSDQFSRSVVSNSSRPHESQHARPPCQQLYFLQNQWSFYSFHLVEKIVWRATGSCLLFWNNLQKFRSPESDPPCRWCHICQEKEQTMSYLSGQFISYWFCHNHAFR